MPSFQVEEHLDDGSRGGRVGVTEVTERSSLGGSRENGGLALDANTTRASKARDPRDARDDREQAKMELLLVAPLLGLVPIALNTHRIIFEDILEATG